MSLLARFLGIGAESGANAPAADTESVRRIAAQLERLPPAQARYVAAFAYVLARVAHADLDVSDVEHDSMREQVTRLTDLSEDEARLVCDIACEQSELAGASENYLVTREFRKIASRDQRAQLLECLFALAAADGEIDTSESYEVLAIAEELGFTRPEALAVRAHFREHLAELRAR